MQGALPGLIRRGRGACLGAALLAAAAAFPPAAARAANEYFLNPEVPQGQWKGVRLKNLPQGAVVNFVFESTGPCAVQIISEADRDRPVKERKVLFAAKLERKLSFKITIPQTGTYYLILDNRRGDADRSVRVGIRAERGKGPAPPRPELEGNPKLDM